MSTFHLTIQTVDGSAFEGEAQRLFCRTINGDVAILARHADYCTALGMGEARVTLEDGTVRRAACIGGMLTMLNNRCRLLATTWEWAENIDLPRAQASQARAEELLSHGNLGDRELALATARLQRALVRTSVATKK